EDGIRDFHVTGVQTCALPISAPASLTAAAVASAAGGQVDSSADGGSRRILPTCSLDSINLWASAAWVIGSRRSTTGRIRPCSTKGHTCARTPRTIRALSAGERLRSVVALM